MVMKLTGTRVEVDIYKFKEEEICKSEEGVIKLMVENIYEYEERMVSKIMEEEEMMKKVVVVVVGIYKYLEEIERRVVEICKWKEGERMR